MPDLVELDLLLDVVKGGLGQRLTNELGLELVAPVELHEKAHSPQVVALVVLLRPLPVEAVLDYGHELVVSAANEFDAELLSSGGYTVKIMHCT